MNENYLGFKTLLNLGAKPQAANNQGTTILHLLMKRNMTLWADRCMDGLSKETKKQFVNRGRAGGWTPLMAAAENNNRKACKWILENGGDVNASMETGWTAMHAAAKKGNTHIVEILLDYGADCGMEATHRNFGSKLTPFDVVGDWKLKKLLRV